MEWKNITKCDFSNNMVVIIRFFHFSDLRNFFEIKHMKDLVELNLSSNNITNLSPLAGLTCLTRLNLSDNQMWVFFLINSWYCNHLMCQIWHWSTVFVVHVECSGSERECQQLLNTRPHRKPQSTGSGRHKRKPSACDESLQRYFWSSTKSSSCQRSVCVLLAL